MQNRTPDEGYGDGSLQSSDLTDECKSLLIYLQIILGIYNYIGYNHNHRPQRFLFFPLSLSLLLFTQMPLSYLYLYLYLLYLYFWGASLLISLHVHLLCYHNVILSTQEIVSSLHFGSVRPKWRPQRLTPPGQLLSHYIGYSIYC